LGPTDRKCHGMESLLGLLFLTRIPITLFMALQVVLLHELYPVEFRNVLKWYAKKFKDTLLWEPSAWFKSFLFYKLVFQLPFFPIATYAFLKGSFPTMTTLIPILSTFLFEDFSKASGFKGQRPETLHERLSPVSVYALYLLIPFVLLMFMLQSPYKYEEKRKKNERNNHWPRVRDACREVVCWIQYKEHCSEPTSSAAFETMAVMSKSKMVSETTSNPHLLLLPFFFFF
uniref:EXPERA domain-containing protein n=1 Tax=Cercocebus atys TaxID=9531 RepID=A0A2K5LWG4_CERAT